MGWERGQGDKDPRSLVVLRCGGLHAGAALQAAVGPQLAAFLQLRGTEFCQHLISKELDSPLLPPEWMQPCWHLHFIPVRSTSDCWPPELQENKSAFATKFVVLGNWQWWFIDVRSGKYWEVGEAGSAVFPKKLWRNIWLFKSCSCVNLMNFLNDKDNIR